MTETARTAPAGWYDDGAGQMRWWDGTQWASFSATPDQIPAPPTGGAQLPQRPRHSALGFLGLSLAVAGTIVACIPQTILFGMTALVVALILSIIALGRKRTRKGPALAGVILSPLGAIAGVIVFLAAVFATIDAALEQSDRVDPVTIATDAPSDADESAADLLPAPEQLNPEVCAAFQEVVAALQRVDPKAPDGWDEFNPLYLGLHQKLEEVSLGERKAVYADFNAAEEADLFHTDLEAWQASNNQFVKVFNDDREWCEAAGLTDEGLEW